MQDRTDMIFICFLFLLLLLFLFLWLLFFVVVVLVGWLLLFSTFSNFDHWFNIYIYHVHVHART